MFLISKVREVVWGKPAATKLERRLLVKIDTVILSFCCLMYWVNYLDRMNLNNAYVSGMKEDLKFKGNQLNVINTSMSPFALPKQPRAQCANRKPKSSMAGMY